jgi:hypothetical protein
VERGMSFPRIIQKGSKEIKRDRRKRKEKVEPNVLTSRNRKSKEKRRN